MEPTKFATYCNYGTQNVLNTVASATDNSSGLAMTGLANSMTNQFANSPLLQSVDQSVAKSTASDGKLALFGYENTNPAPHNHGHVGSFSVGNNGGDIANIGATNGFLPLGPGKGSVFQRQETLDQVKFYILSPSITPKSQPTFLPPSQALNGLH